MARAAVGSHVRRGGDDMTTYRAVMLARKGGPEVLETVRLPLRPPEPGEVRVRVRATGAGFTDVVMRRGSYAYAPPMPFSPGYEVVGEVDALGEGVTSLVIGDRVAALTVHGGWAEFLYREAEHFVKVPPGLDDGEVVALVLNYVTAFQMLHRNARIERGRTILVPGANGGVGTALLELARDAGVRAIGAASEKHYDLVRSYGATPIEGRGTVAAATRAIVPAGVDVAFEGIGGRMVGQCVRATRAGGRVVSYGFTGVVSRALETARGLASLFVLAPLMLRTPSFYGITMIYRKNRRPFMEDLPKLFELLAARAIAPRIHARLGLLDGRRANEMIEAGGVTGKIVLVA
jgi:NADPH:quinone reductase